MTEYFTILMILYVIIIFVCLKVVALSLERVSASNPRAW